MENHERLEELHEALEAYCTYEDDEHGEMVRALCLAAQYDYCMSDDFAKALIKQMEWELENYRKFCRIVKTEETYTREYVELEWNAY